MFGTNAFITEHTCVPENPGEVFQKALESVHGTDLDQVQVLHGDGGTNADTVEFKRARLLPFSSETTSAVAWDLMKRGPFPKKRSTRVTGFSGDVLASEGCVSFQLQDGNAINLYAYCLMKRVATTGGFVVLVESMSEWFAYPASSTPWSHVTCDSGWIAVFDVNESTTEGVCRAQSSIRVTTDDGEGIGVYRDGTFGDIVIPSFC
ncbi:unnamed protein product [Phytophthora lilii]|uniref:Unnamed protein product n=1 Tax=Phytophthora lilii TaxID=2077276 RepID=A0A9W6X2H8_9STRA|nr:unnamed protein product [Phytophthora lilii]